MSTLRHHHGRGIAAPPSGHRSRTGSDTQGSVFFDVIDRPLRKAAGEDAALLRILRGAVISFIAAAVVAVAIGAVV